ncbi:Clp protease N-terminal domain-containing protein [Streptosporangium sp. DT93]|uniref:Clp protease N-terminal domain-containing protein n=1 Tax=Streptosporangium sp. DT93 TaxID=3393428 RepID=UPI003CECE944
MPKINVYLPDELAEAVKKAGVPVSAVCQRALEQAVRRVTAIRETTLSGPDLDDLAARLPNFTPRTRTVIKLAVDQARALGVTEVGTEHLLGGMLSEGSNLALHVLGALEIDPVEVRRRLDRLTSSPRGASSPSGSPASSGPTPASETGAAPDAVGVPDTGAVPDATGGPRSPESSGSAGSPGSPGSAEFSGFAGSAGSAGAGLAFSAAAAAALEMTVTEATSLGHNYVGCEHLLLGLIAEPDGAAGQALRELGAEHRLTRHAVSAALAGYVHLRAQSPGTPPTAPVLPAGAASAMSAAIREELRPVLVRLERLEERLGVQEEDRP